MDIILELTKQFSLQQWQVENVVALLDEGNTLPFIARYRKEAHGTLDDQLLRELTDRLQYLRNLEKRREEVHSAITSLEQMTQELETVLQQAKTLAEIEDIYRPFKPKRRTRASIAKEKGLEPLAQWMFLQQPEDTLPEERAADYLDEEKGVATVEEALQGASDILAEQISDDAGIRRRLRNLFLVCGVVSSTATGEEDSVYRAYYDFSQPVQKMAGHRVLAVNRGEKEGFLKVAVTLEPAKAQNVLRSVVSGDNDCSRLVWEAVQDGYQRLIEPSLEREIRAHLTEIASEDAIKVFAANLRQLLLQPPVKGRVVLGLDPGYRTGCKLAVVEETGRVLDTGVIYPVPPKNQMEEAKRKVSGMVERHHVNMFAIGNGTASKETELFAANLIQEKQLPVTYMVVSEAGASVYSASKLAAEEFPQYDLSLRSAVSIARRLQDPLAELVKIDPKAIGVGQYQHDMPPKRLDEALGGVVEDCVNHVGVDVNTASAALLSHVAGVHSGLAKSIVQYREENGPFQSRTALKKVPKLGPKAFEQCAGFLRVPESANVLDHTGVHPESYGAAKRLLEACGYTLKSAKEFSGLEEKAEQMGIEALAARCEVGVPTLRDILRELQRPGRDPREELPQPLLRTDVMEIKDLKAGMELMGTVRNIVDFGAFVDIGVHQDGLVHISQITNRYIRHPLEVLRVGGIVKVWVVSVDIKTNRISLTMREPRGELTKEQP